MNALMFPPNNVFNIDLKYQTVKEAKAIINELNRDYHRVTIFIHGAQSNYAKYKPVFKELENLDFKDAGGNRWENFN